MSSLCSTFCIQFEKACIVLAISLALFSGTLACADNQQPATSYKTKIRSCDEIWIISTRGIDPCNFVPDQLCVRQFSAGNWEPRTIHQLLQSHRQQDDKPIVMYLHGYRLDYYWARRRGLETYQDLTVDAVQAPPIRFVIWAWPSEDQGRMILNYPEVLRRSMQEGTVLGWFLATAGEGERIGVLSYSLGTQVLGSASENAFACHRTKNCCRSVVVGGATSCRWPANQQQASTVLSGMGRMLRVNNQEDPAVKGYEKGCKLRSRGSAIGIQGLEQFDHESKIQEIDVTFLVKEEHQIHQYLCHPFISRCVLDHLIGRKSAVTDELSNDVLRTIDHEIIEYCEPGNPASNPRPRELIFHK